VSAAWANDPHRIATTTAPTKTLLIATPLMSSLPGIAVTWTASLPLAYGRPKDGVACARPAIDPQKTSSP
jgi:hypothetical protein